MASNSKPASASKSRKSHREPVSHVAGIVAHKIKQLKKQIIAERAITIKVKVEQNKRKLETHVSQLVPSTRFETDVSLIGNGDTGNMLSSRIKSPLCTLTGLALGSGEDTEEVSIPLSGKFASVEKLPSYTTWIFLSRNQRMAKNQSVGRKQIYYDHEHGCEAIVSTDSEEEITEPEEEKHSFSAEPEEEKHGFSAEPGEEKHVFSEAEDRIILMVFEEFEPSEEVLNIVAEYVGGSSFEIQERGKMLKQNNEKNCNKDVTTSAEVAQDRIVDLDKNLSDSLNSLDNLFCRRCLVFGCRLHGHSQDLISPSEKNSYFTDSEEDGKPCGDHCYLQVKSVNKCSESMALGAFSRIERSTAEEPGQYEVSQEISGGPGTCNVSKQRRSQQGGSMLVSDYHEGSSCKKQKKSSLPITVATTTEGNRDLADNSCNLTADLEVGLSNKVKLPMTSNHAALNIVEGQAENVLSICQWKPLEKELYLKGVEIFGGNSCLIARNLLSGMKTCVEVSHYMHEGGSVSSQRCFAAGSHLEDQTAGGDLNEKEIPSRSRLLRRRGRTRKLTNLRKSAGHPAILRRIDDGEDDLSKHYRPCGCQSMCGKQCPCHKNKTCCEKYCGCSKSCKNRFRGCHCAKSQCRTRQCPCFAAQRECDPDICRNCWVSCGDGSLGEPPGRGDGQCGNMRLLLRQHKRILLSRSNVAGWGAFIRNSVNKNDCLGEYTGELISHREADRRGKIYDRSKSSFLFNLNDQYVLDAFRKGDKLKFANHSANPNCYAKVMMVAGDHRVGIFAKDHIEEGEELFYDYHYEPDSPYVWARNPEGLKGDEAPSSQGRARKHQEASSPRGQAKKHHSHR